VLSALGFCLHGKAYAPIVAWIRFNMLKPTKKDLVASAGKTVPDVIAPNLRVLFCGINPGLYSAYTGHHFARPGNRFWPTLFRAGFTEQLLPPAEERKLLDWGYGITNIVERATAAASELSREELRDGAVALMEKVRRYKPKALAVLGVSAYREAFEKPEAQLGLQPEAIGMTEVWVLPNPSGLNANYQIDKLASLFRELYNYVNT
jgi:TDG/mug DNA glycosylase family protein